MNLQRRDVNEPIPGMNGTTVGDFWSWGYSDLMNNLTRSTLAEFVVGSALDCVTTPRIEWGPYDLLHNGIKVEVKSSAYIQSWEQNGHSKIKFDIAKKYQYQDLSMSSPPDPPYPIRPSDCYVFCLYAQKDEEKVDVLNLSDWRFYVMPTKRIDEIFGDQKSVSLSVLERHVASVGFNQVRETIERSLMQ